MPKKKTEKPILEPKKTKSISKKTKKRSSNFFNFIGKDGEKHSINLLQKKFVECYLKCKGNGVEAVIEAGYDVYYRKNGKKTNSINRTSAAVIASQNLIKLNILAYKNILLEQYGFNSKSVLEQHLFLINQDVDLSAKKGAIDMFYKLKGEYAPEKHEHTIKDKLDDLTPEQLEEVIKTGVIPGLNEL